MQQEADFVKDGHPWLVPCCPKVQAGMGYHSGTRCAHSVVHPDVVRGRDQEWETDVGYLCSSEVCQCCMVGNLFANLKTVKRAISQTTHASVLLFLSQELV